MESRPSDSVSGDRPAEDKCAQCLHVQNPGIAAPAVYKLLVFSFCRRRLTTEVIRELEIAYAALTLTAKNISINYTIVDGGFCSKSTFRVSDFQCAKTALLQCDKSCRLLPDASNILGLL